jgi:acyl carrier protein
MIMASITDIYNFIAERSSVNAEALAPDMDLCRDLGIEGDDFFELEAEFEKRFSVDMSTYRWYFHHGEEGWFSIGALFFKSPYLRVQRIPITPALLLQSANAHTWQLSYPEHQLPPRRLDLLFNQLCLSSIMVAGGVLILWKLHIGG